MAEHILWESFDGSGFIDGAVREGAMYYLDKGLENVKLLYPIHLTNQQRDALSYLVTRMTESGIIEASLPFKGQKVGLAAEICCDLDIPAPLITEAQLAGKRAALLSGNDLYIANQFYISQIPSPKDNLPLIF